MGHINIKHPKTGMWRCFSTETDKWVTDWMSEKDYEEWLVQDVICSVRSELAVFGIRKSIYCSYNEAVYSNARIKYKEQHCCKCEHKDCDNCWLYDPVEDYIEAIDSTGDPLEIKDELIKGDD